MKKPSIWLLEADHFHLRLEFRFVNRAGFLLRTKSWELSHKQSDPAKLVLLQINASLITPPTRVMKLRRNYYLITAMVDDFKGDFTISTFRDLASDKVAQQIAAFPLTFGLRMERDAIHLNFHSTTKPT